MALLGAGLTASLGYWQLNRAHQKEALSAHWQLQQERTPLHSGDLARINSSDASQPAEWLDRTASVRGRWLPEHTLFLDNRQMDSRQGFFVLTPLMLEPVDNAPAKTLLVQRGWVPRDFLQRDHLPVIQTPATPVSFKGRLAGSPSRLFDFKGAEQGKIRQNTSIDELSKETGLMFLPWMLVQTEPTNDATDDPQLLRHWAPPATGVEKHYGYAFQWFLLSALITGLYVWFQVIRPRRTKPPAHH